MNSYSSQSNRDKKAAHRAAFLFLISTLFRYDSVVKSKGKFLLK